MPRILIRSLRGSAIVMSFLLWMLLSMQAISAAPAMQEGKVRYDFAVKFECGKASDEEFGVVAQGIYATVINIHDWIGSGGVLEKWAVEALPEEKDQLPPTKPQEVKLREFGAFEIDCREIWRWLDADVGTFHEGFVHLTSYDWYPAVVAVYTLDSGNLDVSMHVQEYEPKHTAAIVVGQPDLLPVPDPNPGTGFCKLREGQLTITIKNQGNVDAPASTTHIAFGDGTLVDLPTSALPAGVSADLTTKIPGTCFRPDCGFEITADSPGAISESDEGNNVGDGFCIG